MGNYMNQMHVHWVDAAGHPATSFWVTLDQTDAVPGAMVTAAAAAQGLSNCGLVAVQSVTTHIVGGSGTNANYPDINDRLVSLWNLANTNAPRQLEIPAPKQGIFLPDNVTLDLSNTLVTTFATALGAVCGDTQGNAYAILRKGNRQRARGGGV
jgi:hypothetical protein